MNLRLALKLMTLPTLIGWLLTPGLLAKGASAAGIDNSSIFMAGQAFCDLPPDSKQESLTLRHQNQGITVASARTVSGEALDLNFSEAESDAAAVLFGCDCSACMNALRQLQSQSLLSSGESSGNGHCWTAMKRRVSPQTVQKVLQNLEMGEAGQKQ